MSIKTKIYILSISLLLLASCSTKYAVVKSNREEYKISNDIQVDSLIIKTYLPYKVKVEAEMNEVIGYTDVVLSKSSSLPESVLGNFFADAVYHQAKKIESNIDFVFPTTTGGLRNDIAKGPITVSSIFELMPFENQLVLLELKGEDVLKVVNYIAIRKGQPVAGLRMTIKNQLVTTLADGSPVTGSKTVPEIIEIKGRKLDVSKNYFVLTSDYIANGGDDAVGFATPISRKNIGLLVRDALLKEVKEIQAAGNKINTKLDGRITKD